MLTTAVNPSIQHLDTSIDQLEKGIDKKDATMAEGSIASWIKTLSSHKDLKHIASHLEDLHKAIVAKKGMEIVHCMEKLGEETTKAATMAEGDEKEKIKKLGHLLTSGAKTIKALVS